MHYRLLHTSLFLTITLLTSATAFTEEPTAAPITPQGIDLQDGDTFVFLGDSITHQRLYTQYVEDFFYQRFPNRRINFHNAGIGGAQAWDALARVSRDVMDYKPRYVSVLLGMNDGRYQPFNPQLFATYQKDMTTLLEKIREGGATPILMSPTMFDSRAAQRTKRKRSPEMLSQYNSVLAYYGRWLQDVSIESGFSYVNMFGLLNDVTIQGRKTDAEFTLIKDSVHPGPSGQIVMAYAMIDDLGLRKPLSNIRLRLTPNGSIKPAANGGKIENATHFDKGIEFDWTADALPWVVPEEAGTGVKMLHLGHKASREGLSVQGLKPGRYHLLIDNTVVGTFSDVQLSRHIELQNNKKTPQYQQALAIAMLNKSKNEGPVKELRDYWYRFQNWARRSRTLKSQPNNTELAATVAKLRAELANMEDVIKKTETDAKLIEEKIYAANHPPTRHYIIRKLP